MPTFRACIFNTGSQYSSLAQSVEHAAVNRRVVGSSPTGGAKPLLSIDRRGFLLFIVMYKYFETI